MNYFRQKADTLIKGIHDASYSAPESEPERCLPEVRDLEMERKVEAMRQKVQDLREQNMLQRAKDVRDLMALQKALDQAKERSTNVREMALKTAKVAPYLAATKEVRDYIVPGIVAQLQAQLCLHLHCLLAHQEQIANAKQDADEMIWWYEDMVKALRQGQADQELKLMNELVNKKIEIGHMLDERTALEHLEERLPQMITGNDNNDNNPRNSINSRGSVRMSVRGSLRPTVSGGRQRVVRKISSRGNANIPRINRKYSSNQNPSRMARTISRNRNTESIAEGEEETVVTGVEAKPEGRIKENSRKPDEATISEDEDEAKPDEGRDASDVGTPASSIEERRVARAARRREQGRGRGRGRGRAPGPNRPSEEREGLAQKSSGKGALARTNTRSRPIQRGPERTRSKSLTSIRTESRRGGKKPDNTSAAPGDIPLFRGFARRDDFEMTRRNSFQEDKNGGLLRGFGSSAPLQQKLDTAYQGADNGSGAQENLTETFKSWMGAMTVKLQEGKPKRRKSRDIFA